MADFFVGNDLLSAAHDISEGGLLVSVFEMLKRSTQGVVLDLSAVHEDLFVAAFSESASRAVVATTPAQQEAVLSRAAELGIPATVIGRTNESGELSLAGATVQFSELVAAWSATLPDLFGHAVGANSIVE